MVVRREIDPTAVAEAAANTALVILGGGTSQRFGQEDKLAADLNGKPLAHHILHRCDGIGFAQRVLVCSQPAAWQAAYQDAGFTIVRNPSPEDGLGSSLLLGTSMVQNAQYILVCLADMPLIERAHIERMLSAYASGVYATIATRSANYMGPPAILPLHAVQNMPAQSAVGARDLIRGGGFIETGLASTHDVDLPADLLLASELLGVRLR